MFRALCFREYVRLVASVSIAIELMKVFNLFKQ